MGLVCYFIVQLQDNWKIFQIGITKIFEVFVQNCYNLFLVLSSHRYQDNVEANRRIETDLVGSDVADNWKLDSVVFNLFVVFLTISICKNQDWEANF